MSAMRLPVEDIAGLMQYSIQQNVSEVDPFAIFNHYGGATKEREHPWELSAQLEHLLKDEHIRHITLAMVDSAEAAARWNNNMQAFVEAMDYGIPVNISSDPRHNPKLKKAEFHMGGAGIFPLGRMGLGWRPLFHLNW